MATTSKATTPKRTPKASSANTENDALKAQIAELEKKITKLEGTVTNLTVALEGKDVDGDGIPDIAGLTARVDNIVGFLKRKWGEGPMANHNIR
tara:strand:- start:1633 stop:1914 length:282 start_codon:yes stop_codon:yes gene_type:complete